MRKFVPRRPVEMKRVHSSAPTRKFSKSWLPCVATSHFSGKTIEGVRLIVTNRDLLSSSRLGLEVAAALTALYPNKIAVSANKDLIGSSGVMRALATAGDTTLATGSGMQRFLELRQKYLLYR